MLRGSAFKAKAKDKEQSPVPSIIASDGAAAGEVLDESSINGQTEAIAPEEGPEGESDAGKLKQLLSVLKKVIGVKVRPPAGARQTSSRRS